MEKEMQEISVYVSDKNYICIKQPNLYEDDDIIIVNPEQINTLIKWLKEAKQEVGDIK
jgi:hypothetical protein